MTQTATIRDRTITLIQRPTVRQFIKFCIIGFSSMLLDVGISAVLIFRFGWRPNLAKTLSFAVAVTNGFIWNSLWTFRGMGSGKMHEQYGKFVLVNIVGYGLNLLLFNLVLLGFTGQWAQSGKPKPLYFALATGVAVVFVSTWNFVANKLWTFRARPSS